MMSDVSDVNTIMVKVQARTSWVQMVLHGAQRLIELRLVWLAYALIWALQPTLYVGLRVAGGKWIRVRVKALAIFDHE